METAIISGIIAAVGVALVNLIKALYSRNQNKKDLWAHEERLIELIGKQNDNSEKLLISINDLTNEVSSIRKELGGLSERVLKLEERT